MLRTELARLGGPIDPHRLGRLAAGWNNAGWQADLPYLERIAHCAQGTTGRILECGTGISTLVASAYARRGVWSLEHLAEWAEWMTSQTMDPRFSATVFEAPLVSYGEYEWYSVPDELPQEFSMVICDGPPQHTQGGRYGLLPQMLDRLQPRALILLDDTDREAERRIVGRWENEFGVEVEEMGAFAVIRCP